MALKAGNEVFGGTTLMRQAMKSPNFVTGVSGWSINQDGSAEFNNVVIRNGQIVSGTALFYSGAPATGNLVASIASTGGTDSHGNAYLAGQTTYFATGGKFIASQSFDGAVIFSIATVAGGPYTEAGFIQQSSTGNLALTISNQPGNPVQTQALLQSQSGFQASGGTNDQVTLTGNAAGGNILSVTNTVAGGASALVIIIAQAAGDPFLGMKVTGDTNNRFVVDTTAGGLTRVRLGPGNAPPDITLIRQAANLVNIQAADLGIATGGRGLRVAEGANAKQGTAVLTTGSVTVATTAVTANSRIFLTMQDNNNLGTPGFLRVSSRIAGTSFTVTSSSGTDGGTFAWEIFEPG